MRVATFSIVGFDPAVEEWGIAVASKFLAAAAVVPWARARVGAIATQALANLSYGPLGLEMLEGGASAGETVDRLTASDDGRGHRQVGIVDARGRSATFTGSECFEWAGGVSGEGFAIQGNILVGREVVERMREAYLGSRGSLADRLLEALLTGDRTGGDRRGRQSAGVVVVREGGGYGGHTDRALDLRVDDHPDPVPELIRLRSLHRLYLEKPSDEDVLAVDREIGREIQDALAVLGAFDAERTGRYDDSTAKALQAYMGIENLEERWLEGDRIDRNVLDYLRQRVKKL